MDSILNSIEALFTVQDLYNSFFEKEGKNKSFLIKPVMENLKGFGGLKKLTVDIYLSVNNQQVKTKTFEVKGTDESKIYVDACKKLAVELTYLILVYGTE